VRVVYVNIRITALRSPFIDLRQKTQPLGGRAYGRLAPYSLPGA